MAANWSLAVPGAEQPGAPSVVARKGFSNRGAGADTAANGTENGVALRAWESGPLPQLDVACATRAMVLQHPATTKVCV